MVNLYTVWHLPKQRIDPTSKRIIYEFPLEYLHSTDSVQLFAECSPHSRMLFALPR